MNNMSRISAISWAARQRGICYGALECQITPDEREMIFQDYRKYKQAEKEQLSALKHGQVIHTPKKASTKHARNTCHCGRPCSFDVHRAYELYHKGYNDCAIAVELQMSVGAIRHWRCKQGLPAVVSRGRPSQKKVLNRTGKG